MVGDLTGYLLLVRAAARAFTKAATEQSISAAVVAQEHTLILITCLPFRMTDGRHHESGTNMTFRIPPKAGTTIA